MHARNVVGVVPVEGSAARELIVRDDAQERPQAAVRLCGDAKTDEQLRVYRPHVGLVDFQAEQEQADEPGERQLDLREPAIVHGDIRAARHEIRGDAQRIANPRACVTRRHERHPKRRCIGGRAGGRGRGGNRRRAPGSGFVHPARFAAMSNANSIGGMTLPSALCGV